MPVTAVSTRAALRSAARGDLVVPRTRRRLGNRAFCVAGPAAWNSLPPDIRTASTLSTFENRHNAHCFCIRILQFNHQLNSSSVFVRRPCSDFTDMLLRLTNCRFIIIILPSVSIPEGGLKIDENKLKGYDAQSVQSGTGRLSCSRTALKRCTSTETR